MWRRRGVRMRGLVLGGGGRHDGLMATAIRGEIAVTETGAHAGDPTGKTEMPADSRSHPRDRSRHCIS